MTVRTDYKMLTHFVRVLFFYQIFLNYDKAGLSSSENTDMRLPDVYIKVKSSYHRAHV